MNNNVFYGLVIVGIVFAGAVGMFVTWTFLNMLYIEATPYESLIIYVGLFIVGLCITPFFMSNNPQL